MCIRDSAWVLDYMTAKDKPLSYIETHAGRGVYDLGADEALKTGEAAAGIALAEALFPPDHPYRLRLDETRAGYGAQAYPGSPLIAALGLRETDTLHLAELHPQECAELRAVAGDWGAHVYQQDGFQLAQALTPPTPRRGLMLIDPSYEVKADYDAIPRHLANIHRKWNVGILILWYPLLRGGAHGPMLRAARGAGQRRSPGRGDPRDVSHGGDAGARAAAAAAAGGSCARGDRRVHRPLRGGGGGRDGAADRGLAGPKDRCG